MSNAPPVGSPGAPHLSYSTPAAAGRTSSYASVAAGAPVYSANSSPYRPASIAPPDVRGLFTNPTPSVQLPRIGSSDQSHRTTQPTSDQDAQTDGGMNIPNSWGRGASNMANYTSQRPSNQSNGNMAGGERPGLGFFKPSYLRGSRYMEKLEAAHEAKLAAQREEPPARAFNPGSLSTSSSSVSLQKMAPSHRGMTYDIVENQIPIDDEVPAPLPSRWAQADKWGGLDIRHEGLNVIFVGGAKLTDHEAAATRADHPMSPECGIYYYEVRIIQKGKDGMIGVGFSGAKASLEKLPGWEPDSWAYHGDDGMSFCCQSTGKPYGPVFTTGDVIGCGVDFLTNQAFFTKNGHFLNYAFKDIRDIRDIKLYPSVGMKRPHAEVEVNFGQWPFCFDIDKMVNKKKEAIKEEIGSADIRKLHSTFTKDELCKALVAQYLSHDGYNETAKAFTQEVHTENTLLRGNPNSDLDSYLSAEEDHDAADRQKIRAAILAGEIDVAINLINVYYPNVLEANPQIFFRLKCRKFVEMMRMITEYIDASSSRASNGKHSKRSHTNGHHVTAHSDDGFELDMDLDEPPADSDADRMDTEDGAASLSPEEANRKHQEVLKQAVFYGQQLKQQFKVDQSQTITEAMKTIFGMFAYSDPRDGPNADLLETKQRVPVAEAVNSAILVSQGKSSSTALERLYKQTVVLVDLISEGGGDGSFVNVESVLKGVEGTPTTD